MEVAGNIYETDFAGLTQWIAESSLLPDDKVRRGDLPWVEARHVSALAPFFAGSAAAGQRNRRYRRPEFQHGRIAEPHKHRSEQARPGKFRFDRAAYFDRFCLAASNRAGTGAAERRRNYRRNLSRNLQFTQPPVSKLKQHCAMHPEKEVHFACRQCLSLFCESCPKTLARVRICPLCGDMCNPHGARATQALKSPTAAGKSFTKANPGAGSYIDPNFTFADFKAAWSYPFRFPVALIVGGIVSALFSFGIYLGLVTTMVGGLFPGLLPCWSAV